MTCQQEKEKESRSGHAFADTTGRFPLDELLRRSGFAIKERRKQQLVLWTFKSTGKACTQRAALLSLSKEDVQTALCAEQLYMEARYG